MHYLFLILSLFSGILQAPSISEVRQLYMQSAEDKAAAKKLLEFSEENEDSALLLGYKAVAEMMMAKHVFNPLSKMSHFSKGKKDFARALDAEPENVEIRFLRFSVQSETPDFLGYKENLEQDKKFLFLNLQSMKDRELKKMILQFLTAAKALSPAEREEMKNRLLKMQG
ncbi:MAG: hypothetical protein WBL27_02495 [Salinimicrobium sp.]